MAFGTSQQQKGAAKRQVAFPSFMTRSMPGNQTNQLFKEGGALGDISEGFEDQPNPFRQQK